MVSRNPYLFLRISCRVPRISEDVHRSSPPSESFAPALARAPPPGGSVAVATNRGEVSAPREHAKGSHARMGNNRSQQTFTAKRFGRPGHWLAVLVVAVAVAGVVAVPAGAGSRAPRGPRP